MSIIYDALQKIQKTRRHATESVRPAAIVNKRENENSSLLPTMGKKIRSFKIGSVSLFSKISRRAVAFSLASVAIFGVAFYFVSARNIPEKNEMVISKITEIIPVASAKEVWHALVSALPKRRTIVESQYKAHHKLNGVFLSSDEKLAMINNKMFHRGDEVDGMVVNSIDVEGVQMRREDQVIFLRSQS